MSIKCAVCGESATLRGAHVRRDGTYGHDIAADGTVHPSIVCPFPPCTWHVWGRLLEWTPLP